MLRKKNYARSGAYESAARSKSSSVSIPSILCSVGICIFRLLGYLFCILVIINFSGWLLHHTNMSALSFGLSRLLPEAISGKWVVPTPLDGLFRSDFAISACICFMLDYVCCLLKKRFR